VSSHSDWDEIAAGHALGALEPDDEQRFEAHLRTCADCRQVLLDTEVVMAELAVAPDPVAPPPELKIRLMAAIHEAADDEPRMAAVSPRDTLEIIRERKRSTREALADKWVRFAAAASVILLAVIAAGVWSLGGSKSATPRFVALNSAQSPTTQVATVALIGDKAWTISAALPANDTASSQYVLWAVPTSGASPVPIGSFDVAPGHTVSPIGKVSESLSSVKAFAVSKEPGRTLPTKPTVVVASGALT
jgi:anti-sigma-K factor RskA